MFYRPRIPAPRTCTNRITKSLNIFFYSKLACFCKSATGFKILPKLCPEYMYVYFRTYNRIENDVCHMYTSIHMTNTIFYSVTPTYYIHLCIFQLMTFLLLQPSIHHPDPSAMLLDYQLIKHVCSTHSIIPDFCNFNFSFLVCNRKHHFVDVPQFQ